VRGRSPRAAASRQTGRARRRSVSTVSKWRRRTVHCVPLPRRRCRAHRGSTRRPHLGHSRVADRKDMAHVERGRPRAGHGGCPQGALRTGRDAAPCCWRPFPGPRCGANVPEAQSSAREAPREAAQHPLGAGEKGRRHRSADKRSRRTATGHRPDSGECLRIFVGDRLVSPAGIDDRHGAALAPAG